RSRVPRGSRIPFRSGRARLARVALFSAWPGRARVACGAGRTSWTGRTCRTRCAGDAIANEFGTLNFGVIELAVFVFICAVLDLLPTVLTVFSWRLFGESHHRRSAILPVLAIFSVDPVDSVGATASEEQSSRPDERELAQSSSEQHVFAPSL